MKIRSALAAACVAALFAAGCSGADDASETTPAAPPSTAVDASEPAPATQSASPEPAPATEEPGRSKGPEAPETAATPELSGDEAERYALVASSFRAYWDVINQTYADGGAEQPTEDMLRVMTGQQLSFWSETFAKWKADGNRYEGVNVVLYANPKQVSLSEAGGVADVEFCVDMRNTRAFDADGNPLNKDGRYQSGVAVLEWVEGAWKVAGHREGTANKDVC